MLRHPAPILAALGLCGRVGIPNSTPTFSRLPNLTTKYLKQQSIRNHGGSNQSTQCQDQVEPDHRLLMLNTYVLTSRAVSSTSSQRNTIRNSDCAPDRLLRGGGAAATNGIGYLEEILMLLPQIFGVPCRISASPSPQSWILRKILNCTS